MTDEFTLEFTTNELYLLLSLFGPAIAFGIGEPYLGKFIEEIETAQRGALDSLIRRDLIRVSEANEAAIDEVLAKIIQTCAKPEQTVIATTQTKGEDKQIRYLHFGSEMVVEHTPLDEIHHRLVPLPQDAGNSRLEDILHLNGQPAATGGMFRLIDEKLFEARDLVIKGNPNDADTVFRDAGLNVEQANQLIRALTDAISNSSVVVIANRDDAEMQNVDGLGVLEGKEGLWVMNLRRNEKTTEIEFVPSTAQDISQRVRGLLSR